MTTSLRFLFSWRHAAVAFASRCAALAAALVLGVATSVASAQILIGRTAGITGPVAAGVNETGVGAQMVIDAVNANGGVNGQRIELITLDDAFTPARAGDNAKQLIVERQVVSMFLTRGTPHTQRIMPLLTEFGVPLVEAVEEPAPLERVQGIVDDRGHRPIILLSQPSDPAPRT